jgi:hypothetical protein
MRLGRRAAAGLSAISLMLGVSGCDSFGPGETIGQFEWSELPNAPVTEFSSAETFGSEIVFLGEFNTPTSCFRVTPQYDEAGATGTLRIRSVLVNQPNCGQSVTSFRYQGQLRDMDGITELRVRHEVEGEQSSEFVHDLTAG